MTTVIISGVIMAIPIGLIAAGFYVSARKVLDLFDSVEYDEVDPRNEEGRG